MPATAPDNLLAQWFLLGAIIRDDRCRAIHAKVAWPILEAYFKKHGNGRASVRYLETATGLTKGSIATATADLIKFGYFTRQMGKGKQPSEYTPNWELASVLQRQDVLQPQDAMSVLQSQDTCVPSSQDAKSSSVPSSQDKTLLLNPLTSGVTEERNSAGATGAGLTPAPCAVPFLGQAKIVSARYQDDEDTASVELGFENAEGDVFEHWITVDCSIAEDRQAGLDELNRLAAACGIDELEDVTELVGKPVSLGESFHGFDRTPMATYSRGPEMDA